MERDGERVLAALGACLAECGLTFHATMTRHADFRPRADGHGTSNRFAFLGFIRLRGRSRKGCWVVRQFTAKARLARAVESVWNRCNEHRHMPLGDQSRYLAGVIREHSARCGPTGKGSQFPGFRNALAGSWRRWLGWRHLSGRTSWDRSMPSLFDSPCQMPRARGRSMPLSEPVMRGPGCVDRAHSDLWVTGLGNDPVYPAPVVGWTD